MKNVLVIAVTALCIAGCQQPLAGSTPASSPTIASTTPAAAPALFEIRDFTRDEEEGKYTTTVKGRGTLVTKDARLSNGNYMVWLSAKQEHVNDEPWRIQVLLKDGIGTFGTFDIPDKGEKIKYYDWEILGYLPMEKGQIKAVGNPPAKES